MNPEPGMVDSVGRIAAFTHPKRGPMLLVAALSLLDMGLNAQLSLSFKYLIDHVIVEKDHQALWMIIGALCVSILVVTATGLWRDRLYASITGDLCGGLRQKLFAHLQKLSAGFYANTSSGDILSRFSLDLGEIERTFLNGVPWGILPVLDAALSIGLAFWLDWRLAIVALLAIPLSLLGPKLLAARTAEASSRRKQDESDLVSSVQENVAAQSLVKAFSLENFFLRNFHARNLGVAASSTRLGFLLLLMERSAVTSTLLLQMSVLGIGGYLVLEGQITVGTFAAFQTIFATLMLSLSSLAQYVPQLAQASSSFAHIEELLAEKQQVQDAAQSIPLPAIANEITFRDVSFSYDGTQKNLDGVNLTIPCGSSVAFVGPSGSGKSTILTLLMRFYDPASGCVAIDSNDLREVSQTSLRSQTAIVFQDNFLLHTSLRENIRIANPLATSAEIEDAARQSGLHDFINALPEGYDTVVAQGRLSGGQRQRLGIARALVRNPRILILDEATSALDAVTEAMINSTIERVSKGRTVLSVTHRLGSAVNADRIFFLDKGVVVEQGSHQHLLALGGGYAKLWGKQSGFEISSEDGHARITPDRLRGFSMLADLDDSVLAELSASFSTELCSKDQFLFHEGDSGDKFYIVVRGTLEVLKLSIGGATRRVEVLQDGDVFGEQALLMNAPRSASVRSLAESTLLVLTGDKFQALMDRVPKLRWKLRESATIGEYRNDEAAAGAVSPWSKYRHDLLTPVNHMLGYSEMLADEFEESGQASSLRLARLIGVTTRRVQDSIDATLPSGRIPMAGAVEQLRADVASPLAEIIAATADLRRTAKAGSQIDVDASRVDLGARHLSALLEGHNKGHQPAVRTQTPASYASASTSDHGHILVVDDNDTSRDLLCRKLERDGYLVSAASGGLMAIEMTSTQHGFDLVLLDVMMPDIDGIEVLRRWKVSGQLALLPVIVTSAMDEVSSAVRCIELGADDYLTKPFDPVLLKTRIRTSIEKKKNL